jgi:hypothetical protein
VNRDGCRKRFAFSDYCASLQVSSTNVKEVIQCQERYWSEVSEQLGRYPVRAAPDG